jgi:hypothetical protein
VVSLPATIMSAQSPFSHLQIIWLVIEFGGESGGDVPRIFVNGVVALLFGVN